MLQIIFFFLSFFPRVLNTLIIAEESRLYSMYSNRYNSYMMLIHNNTGSGSFRFMNLASVYCSSTIKGCWGIIQFQMALPNSSRRHDVSETVLPWSTVASMERSSGSLVHHQIPDLIDHHGRHCIIFNCPNNSSMQETRKHSAQNIHSNYAKVNVKPPGAIRLLNQDDRNSIYKKSLRSAHDHVTTCLCIALESSANSAGDRHFLLCLIAVPSA